MLAGEAGSRGGLLSPGLSPCPCLLKIEDHSAPAFSEPQKTKSGDSLKKKKKKRRVDSSDALILACPGRAHQPNEFK